MSLLSEKILKIKPSPTLAVTAKAQELKAKNIDVISLGAGEPDFDTPKHIKNAAKKAIDNGSTKYTAVGGTKELKEAIINKFARENKLTYNLEEVTASTGGKQVIFNAMLASLNDGDEVIIPSPYWVSYPAIVEVAGGKPVIIEGNENFKLTAAILKQAITQKTKWLILNSPSNPTGCAYSRQELKDLAEVIKEHNLYVLSDDIYEHIIYDEFEFTNIVNIEPALKNNCLIVNGVSKAYSMTGWRLGYGAGPKELIKAMEKIQSQSTSNPCSISQAAAIEALTGTQDFINANNLGFKRKRDLVCALIAEIDYLECKTPEGAFYVFVNCKAAFNKQTENGNLIENSVDFANYLLEEANVAVVPGIAFGMEGYFRISYATSEELIAEACKRIETAVSKLK